MVTRRSRVPGITVSWASCDYARRSASIGDEECLTGHRWASKSEPEMVSINALIGRSGFVFVV